MYKSDILELLLTIASNTTNEADSGEWNVLVLEILYNIIKHVSPKDVFFYKEMIMTNKNNVRKKKVGFGVKTKYRNRLEMTMKRRLVVVVVVVVN